MHDFKLLERKLKNIAEHLANKLSKQDLLDVKEYIYHGEYGLAYELLCYLIIEQNLKVTQEICEDIINLGKLMKIKENVWNQINCSKDDK